MGAPVENTKEISDFFSDEGLSYFGHGTGRLVNNDSIIQSIFETGLKVVNPEAVRPYFSGLQGLDSTSISLGTGSTHLFSHSQNTLDNWPHLDSKRIVICALPKDFILPFRTTPSMTDMYKAFYIGSDEDGYVLRPEFIKGYYDAEQKSFIPNEHFYQNLEPDKQHEVIDSVISNYVEAYSQNCTRSPFENLDFPRDLVDEMTASIQWYKVQLQRLREAQEKKNSLPKYDPSHDFDDVFYSDSEHTFDPDSQLTFSEQEWEELFVNTKSSDFNDMLKDIKSEKSHNTEDKEDSKTSIDKGDDNDER